MMTDTADLFNYQKGGDTMNPAVIAAIISGAAGILTAIIDACDD